ncbi:hypothetical protein PAXRUDRAFT_229369 [Paxillus rubicundulus Ve08.2h10]|uniref:Uncharacterized protein n=1 Tax=Paxillus rubicundulus Ve08.2h10 TaxID=930991 RepID=A0A0D0CY84_9AGAM|nr:hypothetical protein PAXRUDRAFT_229369 [Paxillus rubicundulus Ve08.2h10]
MPRWTAGLPCLHDGSSAEKLQFSGASVCDLKNQWCLAGQDRSQLIKVIPVVCQGTAIWGVADIQAGNITTKRPHSATLANRRYQVSLGCWIPPSATPTFGEQNKLRWPLPFDLALQKP